MAVPAAPAAVDGAALSCIRAATRDLHLGLESRLPLLSSTLTRASYTRIVAAFYGYYRPLESLVAPFAAGMHELEWPHRVKLPWLVADLEVLGVGGAALARLPVCTELPAPSDAAQALGCMYVMEGATLGGQLTARALCSHLGLTQDSGAAFFSSYGDAVGRQWRNFRSCLAGLQDSEQVSAAADAARRTFVCLENWLSQREVLT